MKHEKIIKALRSLKPNAEWRLDGEKLIWLDKTQTEPTQSQIDAEIVDLDNVYAAKKYQRDRAAEYPAVVDQLDEIYHNGIDAWKTTIKKIKDKHPKP